MKQIDKKRFIAGAVCPHCGQMDKICWIIAAQDERIECVNCGYVEYKPQSIKPAAVSEQTLQWFPSKPK